MPVITPTTKKLAESLGIKNIHAVPRVTKVVVTVGVGKQRDNKQHIEAVQKDLAAITGQKPRERRARQSIAGFNVREGNLVGYTVTLRGKRMEDFLTRFVDVTLPRVRDFRGLSLSVLDGQGNASIGLTEHLPFPEIQADKTDVIFGVGITFVTTAKNNETAEQMFRALGFPFRTEELEEN
jgi:large subunit ribosomal protein L5